MTATVQPTLIATRGLPGCGKTTKAREWVAQDPAGRARVNRDDLRACLHGSWLGTGVQEEQVTAAQHAAITALLARGVDVVCDDTNLVHKHAVALHRLAGKAGALFEVWDMTDVPPGECIDRDAIREAPERVGADVIVGMWRRHLKGKPCPLPWPVDPAGEVAALVPYVPPADKPRAVLVDLDGTMCVHNGRSPYDESRVGEDLPNHPVIAAVTAMADAGHRVIFLSGRSEACRTDSLGWLDKYYPYDFEFLSMRSVGDTRYDSIVKAELFNDYIRDDYQVTCVFDDRDQVVEMWRRLGLTVMQVAPGDF